MSNNAAIYYLPDGYDTHNSTVVGRRVAGEAFLKAYLKHSLVDTFYCYTSGQKVYENFCQRAKWLLGKDIKSKFIPFSDQAELCSTGCVYYPSPGIATLAWQRRYYDPKHYSVCGVTHTTATAAVMDQLCELLTGPVEAWDALICTSDSVKSMVQTVLDDYSDYLKQRIGRRPKLPIQLPVIPLGVDTERFKPSERNEAVRKELRGKLGIKDNDIAILFMGRLSFHSKAHPLPMFMALQRVAERTSKQIHLIQSGWFAKDEIKDEFLKTAKRFSPKVRHVFVDGRVQNVRDHIWAAADIFTSLSDNIQETFGITPIEGKAAGLPVVVSDWDGYRNTVRHETDGFLIPTLAPAQGNGYDIARSFADGSMNYDHYIGATSQTVVVDIDALAHAYETLISNPQMRKKMGEAGREDAFARFEWNGIVRQYQDLWQELANIRAKKKVLVPVRGRQSIQPMRNDPYRIFESYPNEHISRFTKIRRTETSSNDHLKELLKTPMANFAMANLLANELQNMLKEVVTKKNLTVDEVIQSYPDQPEEKVVRSLAWLAKYNLIKLAN